MCHQDILPDETLQSTADIIPGGGGGDLHPAPDRTVGGFESRRSVLHVHP